MKMKKIVLALIVALMGTIVTNAQPPRHQEMSLEQMVQMRVDRMDRQLNLTEDQKTEIARIYTEEMTAMKQEREARMADGQQPDESKKQARHDEMNKRRQATDAKIEALLTPEQAAKYAEVKKHEGKRGHHGQDRKGMHEKRDMKSPRGAKMAPRHEGTCNECTCNDKKNDEKK